MNKNVATLGIGVIITLESLFSWGNLIPWQLSIVVGIMVIMYGSYNLIRDRTVSYRFLYVGSAWLALIAPIIYTVVTYEKPKIVHEKKQEVYLKNDVLNYTKIPISLDEEIHTEYRAKLSKNKFKLIFPKLKEEIIDSVHFHINDKTFHNSGILKTCSLKKNFSMEICSSGSKFTAGTEMFNHGNEYRIGWKLVDEIDIDEIIVVTLQIYASDTSKFVILDFGNYEK